MPLMSSPLTQAAVWRMIKESVNAAIASERVRHANAGNNASGSGQARVQVTAPVVRECTFVGFMKCNTDNFQGTKGVVELRRWFEKMEMNFGISECAEDKKVKFAAATLRGPALTWWISKVGILGLDVANQMGWTEMKKLMTTEMVEPETVRMAYKLMEQKLQARNERILEGNKRKWENFQSGNNSAKSNNKDNSRQSSQNNQKQGNARAMTTALNEGKVFSGSLLVCERCFTRHVGQCTIKFHKCGKVRHKASKVIRGTNAQRRLRKRNFEKLLAEHIRVRMLSRKLRM
ncbi:hypothetical protein Tco_1074630 [Tanacetum coccineum]